MTRRTWVAVAAGTLIAMGAAVLIVNAERSDGPPESSEPPLAAQPPRADLRPPEQEGPCPLPTRRWPLGAPVTIDVADNPNWSSPKPLHEPVQTTAGFAPRPRFVEPPDWLDRPVKSAVRQPTLLTGTHVSDTSEGRLILPPSLRDQLGDLRDARGRRSLFLTPGKDGCLWVLTAAGLERLIGRVEMNATTSFGAREARRQVLSQAEVCAVDRDGGMSLPEGLANFAGLGGQVVLVGVGDYVELWDARRWQTATQP